MVVLLSLLLMLRGLAQSRTALHLRGTAGLSCECHQLHVLRRSRPQRLRLVKAERWLWAWLSRSWTGWQTAFARRVTLWVAYGPLKGELPIVAANAATLAHTLVLIALKLQNPSVPCQRQPRTCPSDPGVARHRVARRSGAAGHAGGVSHQQPDDR